eukprot:PhM_4_TR1259/c0_g1_i5/m.81302
MKSIGVVLLLFAVLTTPNPTQAAANEIVFGQSAAITGTGWTPGGRVVTGINAAFKVANDAGGIYGRKLVLRSYDDHGNATLMEGYTNTLISMPDVVALVGYTGTAVSQVAAGIAEQNKIILFGPMTGHESVRQRNPMNPYVVHVRASYVDEAVATYKAFVTNLRLKRFAVVYSSLFKPQLDIVARTLMWLGISLIVSSESTDITAQELAKIVVEQDLDAAFMFTGQANVIDLLEALYKIDPNSKFVAGVGSWVNDDVVNGLKARGLPATGVYASQVTPHPTSPTDPTSIRYRSAMRAYVKTVPNSVLDFDDHSFEGYVIGRMLIDIATRMDGVSRDSFYHAVYGVGIFLMDHYIVGPYSDTCPEPVPAAVGVSAYCNCSSGLKRAGIKTYDSAYESHEFTSITVPFREC